MAQNNLMTPPFKANYTFVIEPNKQDKFSISMIFNKAKIANDPSYGALFKAILAEIKAVGLRAFPDGQCKRIQPMRDGDKDKPNNPHYENSFFCEATTQYQPELFDRNKQDILSKKEFYAGCIARARIHVYSWDKNGGGVSIGFDSVQKLEDGEPIAGPDAKDDFDELGGTNVDVNLDDGADDLLL